MRRPAPVDLMLIATVVIWAFNITVTKYVLTHGFKPLAYASIRYGAAALLFGALTIALERTLRVGGGRSLLLLGAAAVVLLAMSVAFLAASSGQLGAQDYGKLGWLVWLCLAFAIVGPLLLTNVLYFTAIHRVGPSRASLFTNLQPFVAAVFAFLILSEHLYRLQVAGGVAILFGILLERRSRPSAAPPVE